MSSDQLLNTSTALAELPVDGLCPASPQVQIKTIGVLDGRFYEYGETQRSRVFFPPETPAVYGAIVDLHVAKLGKAGSKGDVSWQGERDHLSVLLQSPSVELQYRLIIPAYNAQVSYRTLLGHLLTLDLRATAVKLEATPGRTEGVTIFKVSLDHQGLHQVKGPWIGDQPGDLQIAVDACRRSLGLLPQFPEWVTPESPTPSPQTSCSDY